MAQLKAFATMPDYLSPTVSFVLHGRETRPLTLHVPTHIHVLSLSLSHTHTHTK